MSKVIGSIREAILASGLRDGMTIGFHHHLRSGDHVLNMVMEEIAALGIKDITINASSIFDTHAPLIDHMKNGVVTGLMTNYMGSLVGRAVSEGILRNPVIFHTHGSRAANLETGTAQERNRKARDDGRVEAPFRTHARSDSERNRKRKRENAHDEARHQVADEAFLAIAPAYRAEKFRGDGRLDASEETPEGFFGVNIGHGHSVLRTAPNLKKFTPFVKGENEKNWEASAAFTWVSPGHRSS